MSAWHARRTGVLRVFATQPVVDLLENPCDGGLPQDVVTAIVGAGGRMCDSGGDCVDTGVSGYGLVRMVDEHEPPLTQDIKERRIADALFQRGCLVIAMDAQPEWASYSGGLLVPPLPAADTATPEVNHAMLLVGFDNEEDGTCWWLVQNSWGPWGEGGFLRIPRGKNAAAWGANGPFGMYSFDPVFIK
jgi:hypothetical protein